MRAWLGFEAARSRSKQPEDSIDSSQLTRFMAAAEKNGPTCMQVAQVNRTLGQFESVRVSSSLFALLRNSSPKARKPESANSETIDRASMRSPDLAAV